MVISFFVFLLFTFASLNGITISAEIDSNTVTENQPIAGIISIIHTKEEKIDPEQFTIEGTPLKVKLQKESVLNGNIISLYSFTLPAKSKGLYFLPPITIPVDGKSYSSFSSSYQIKEQKRQIENPQKVFILESAYEGPQPLYPGQRGYLIYRIYFNQNIDISAENLDFPDIPQYKKIGDVQFKYSQEGDLSGQQISQEIEAKEPGEFYFGKAQIEGYAYSEDILGNKIYEKENQKTESTPLNLIVKAFPPSRPPAFTGSIGQFSFQVSNLSPSSVYLGDRVQLSLEVSGKENLDTVEIPSLACQPGFSGFFILSNTPIAGDIEGNKKKFQIDIFPAVADVISIPSIEFAFFNPQSNQYVILKSNPIPLTILRPNNENVSALSLNPYNVPLDSQWMSKAKEQTPLVKLRYYPFYYAYFKIHFWVILLLIPLGILLIQWQKFLKRK